MIIWSAHETPDTGVETVVMRLVLGVILVLAVSAIGQH